MICVYVEDIGEAQHRSCAPKQRPSPVTVHSWTVARILQKASRQESAQLWELIVLKVKDLVDVAYDVKAMIGSDNRVGSWDLVEAEDTARNRKMDEQMY